MPDDGPSTPTPAQGNATPVTLSWPFAPPRARPVAEPAAAEPVPATAPAVAPSPLEETVPQLVLDPVATTYDALPAGVLPPPAKPVAVPQGYLNGAGTAESVTRPVGAAVPSIDPEPLPRASTTSWPPDPPTRPASPSPSVWSGPAQQRPVEPPPAVPAPVVPPAPQSPATLTPPWQSFTKPTSASPAVPDSSPPVAAVDETPERFSQLAPHPPSPPAPAVVTTPTPTYNPKKLPQ